MHVAQIIIGIKLIYLNRNKLLFLMKFYMITNLNIKKKILFFIFIFIFYY